MATSYTETYTLNYERSNALNEWQLSSLLNAFTSVSVAHDRALEQGQMAKQNLLWIITQHDIHIQRLPENGETLRVTTTAWGHNAFFCFRSYAVADQTGTEIIHGDTSYMLIDATTRQVARIPKQVITRYESVYTKRGPHFPRLQRTLTGLTVHEHPHVVQFTDLDTNGHTSNTVYLDWIVNDLGWEWQQQYVPCHLAIKYEKELLYHQSLTTAFAVEPQEHGRVITHHRIQSEAVRHALLQITWQPRSGVTGEPSR